MSHTHNLLVKPAAAFTNTCKVRMTSTDSGKQLMEISGNNRYVVSKLECLLPYILVVCLSTNGERALNYTIVK